MLELICNLLYPPVCGLCGKIDSNFLCKKCEIQLKKIAVFGIDNYKEDIEKYYDEHLYIFMYNSIIRKAIINYKFNDKAYIYKTFVKFLLKNENFVTIIKKYDIILPVPLSKKRAKIRGYNQSGLIAKDISKNLNIQINQKSLKKTQNIVPQSTLNREQRSENIKGVYKLKNPQKLENKKVLIIDDIYTTGSTINECSKVISIAGTKKIGVLTIAKD